MAHCDPPDPDGCFGCKVQYWRRHGAPGVIYQAGQAKFHESTIGERNRAAAREAAVNGIEIRPQHPIYDKPANFGEPASVKRDRRRNVERAYAAAVKEVRGKPKVTTGA